MAYNYEGAKKAYQSMTREQQQQYVEKNKNDANFQRFAKEYAAEMGGKSTPTSIPTVSSSSSKTSTTTTPEVSTANSVKADVAMPEYQGTGSNKANIYQNQGAGNYSYDTGTKYYEKQGTPANTNYSSTRNAWDALSYEQQQEKLNQNPNLREGIIRIGGTIKEGPTWAKTSPYQNQGEGQYQYNPKTGYYEKRGEAQGATQGATQGWDYQDNSQARMDEIANNLNNYRITNPDLFDNWGSFYNFFIAGKGRTPEQEKFLTDYYNNMKRYNDYDNLSSDEVGGMIARGEIPDDYLNYLKNSDPQRWAEIQGVRKDTEDQIMNETYLNTVAGQAGFDMGDSDWWKWNKTEMGYRDVNNDGLDDRLYHEPTEEELKLVDENNQYEQERAKLTDAMKWLQEDLTNQYPDADLSTIMLLTSDRGNKIQRALDTLAVSQTKVQGSLKYLQNERATMDEAGQRTINEIQKQYGLYYDYSPQGMAELAQAKYAATNITLDQADNGTETQKQMALQNVLDGYYQKYGDIIQRSEAQVINDVIAYAKKNGVSLSQALQENFVKQLQQKPEYQQMQAILSEPNLQIIGYNSDGKAVYGYWDSVTKSFNQVNVGGGSITPTTDGEGTSYITNSQPLNNFITNLETKYTIASNGGTGGSKIRSGGCGTVVNDYLGSVGSNIKLTEANDIKPYATSKTPVEGAVVYFDGTQSRATPETKKHGHVGIVVSDNGDTITVLESNEGTGLRYNDYKKSGVTGYYVPDGIKTTEYNQKEYSNAFTKAGDIVSTGIEGQGNKQMFKETLQGLLDEGDYTGAFEYITITGKNNAKGDAKDKIQAAETAMVDLISIRDALDAYYAAGGDTGILQGSLEKVANKLGKTTDPKLVGLATKISEAIQAYRKNISGTAFSEKEAEEYEALFPTIAAGQEYNNSKLTSTLDSMVIRLNQLYGGLIGPRTYINVLDAHEKATGNRYSMYEQQSQLYNYLSNNGYLKPDGSVKTADDFANWYQSQKTQRKGKRF